MVLVKNNLLVGSPRKLGIRLLFLHEKSDMLLVEDLLLPQHSICIRTVKIRYCPRFFDQVGHQTAYASIGSRHFCTISCNCQSYQNYEQSQQKLGTFLENKVHTLKIKVFKKLRNKSWSPSEIFFTKKNSERFGWFLT